MTSILRHLDFNLFKALEALLEEKNVTRAAKRLGVTQPAMSGMLTRLREHFNDPLFVRVPHGIHPTDRALALISPVREMMADITRMLQPAEFDPKTAEISISIASTDYGLATIVTPFLIELKRHAPNIQIALFPIQDNQVQTRLEQGKLDIALMDAGHLQTELHKHTLYRENYTCVMRKTHPMADKSLTLENFCELEFAMMSYDGGGFYGVTDEALAKLGKRRRVSLSVTNFLVLPEILRYSDIVSMIPNRMPLSGTDLIRKPAPIEVSGFNMDMVWHERTDKDTAHQWIRNLLIAHLENH